MRRPAQAFAASLALLVGACGSRAPVTLVVERLDETQVLLVEAASTVGAPYGQVEVLRTLALEPEEAGSFVLKPLDVYVRGEFHRTAEDGARVYGGRSSGLDRSAQAATEPHLTPFWASARVEASGRRVEIGLLLRDGTFFGPHAAPAGDTPTIDDAVPFLTGRIPDAVLGLVAANAAGAWPPGAERVIEVEVDRGARLPALEGRLVLRRGGGRTWRAHLAVDWRAEGEVASSLAWRVVHRVSGFVSVGTDGRLGGASLASVTRVLDGREVMASSRHRLELGTSVPTVWGHEAEDLARLLSLRRSNKRGFQQAVLEQSAASARAMVQRVRPTADLTDITVAEGHDVDLRVWQDAPPARSVGLERALALWAPWSDRLAALRGPAAPGDGRSEAESRDGTPRRTAPRARDAAADRDDWCFAWPRLGILTVGRGRIGNLRALSHEYAHFANARFAYADLERVGLVPGMRDTTWVDVDGVLATALLEEAGAEATATCAALAAFAPTEQRNVVWWYGKQDTAPTAEPDFRRRLFALAYGYVPAVLAATCDVDDDLEAAIAKAWASFTYRTRQLLFPRDEVRPSTLWPRARTLATDGAVDGTRVGAFGLLHLLDDLDPAQHADGLSLVRALEDDVVVAADGGGLLWITVWRDEETARRFRGRLEGGPSGEVAVTGRHVTVRVGSVPRAEAWRRRLLGEAAAAATAPIAGEAADVAPREPDPRRAAPK